MTPGKLMQVLQPYKGQTKLVVDDHTTGDIIAAISNAHNQHLTEYAKIAPFFRAKTDREVSRKIFDFLKENILYQIEPGTRQTVKSPAALLAHGYGDCKHYSKFAAGILQNLGIPYAYRFASYKYNDPLPGHVFVVVNPGTKNEIWIDPVLPAFDMRKPYFHAKDKTMAVYSISGIGRAKRKAARRPMIQPQATTIAPAAQTKKQQRKAKQAARKAAGKTLGQKLKKGTRIVAKVAAAPARNSFLLLVRINFGNLAVRLANAWAKAPGRLQNFWEGLGGQMNALKKAFEKGKTKRRILGFESEPEIGALPAAAAAAAAPILAAVAKFLKDLGIDPGELVQLGKEAVNNKVQQMVANKLVNETERVAVQNAVAEQMDEVELPAGSTQTTATTGRTNMLPLIIGGVAVAYLLTRKK